MPRNWVVVAYQNRIPLTANLVVVFVLTLVLNTRKPFDNDADIFVLEINGDARAYPRDWMQLPHIVGDEVGGQEAVMTYCALSNLPMAFDRKIKGQDTDLKVIAQVNSNLIFADDISGEMVQQITGTTELGQGFMTRYPTQRMPWKSFKALYPDGKVFDYQPTTLDKLSLEAFDITLESHYQGQPMFPTLNLDDTRLDTGEPVWGLNIEGEQLAITKGKNSNAPSYTLEHFG